MRSLTMFSTKVHVITEHNNNGGGRVVSGLVCGLSSASDRFVGPKLVSLWAVEHCDPLPTCPPKTQQSVEGRSGGI